MKNSELWLAVDKNYNPKKGPSALLHDVLSPTGGTTDCYLWRVPKRLQDLVRPGAVLHATWSCLALRRWPHKMVRSPRFFRVGTLYGRTRVKIEWPAQDMTTLPRPAHWWIQKGKAFPRRTRAENAALARARRKRFKNVPLDLPRQTMFLRVSEEWTGQRRVLLWDVTTQEGYFWEPPTAWTDHLRPGDGVHGSWRVARVGETPHKKLTYGKNVVAGTLGTWNGERGELQHGKPWLWDLWKILDGRKTPLQAPPVQASATGRAKCVT